MSNYKSNSLKLKELIKECIPVSNFDISFGTIEENAVRACKINLPGLTNTQEKTGDNEIINQSTQLIIDVNSGTSIEDVDEGLKFCADIYKALNKVINKVNDDKTLGITHIDSSGGIDEYVANKHGIWCFSMKFTVYYNELD